MGPEKRAIGCVLGDEGISCSRSGQRGAAQSEGRAGEIAGDIDMPNAIHGGRCDHGARCRRAYSFIPRAADGWRDGAGGAGGCAGAGGVRRLDGEGIAGAVGEAGDEHGCTCPCRGRRRAARGCRCHPIRGDRRPAIIDRSREIYDRTCFASDCAHVGRSVGRGDRGNGLADYTITRIYNIKVARSIDCDAARVIKSRGTVSPVVRARAARTGEGRDDASKSDFSNSISRHFADVKIACAIQRDADRGVKSSRCAGGIIGAGCACAGHRGHDTYRINFSD